MSFPKLNVLSPGKKDVYFYCYFMKGEKEGKRRSCQSVRWVMPEVPYLKDAVSANSIITTL